MNIIPINKAVVNVYVLKCKIKEKIKFAENNNGYCYRLYNQCEFIFWKIFLFFIRYIKVQKEKNKTDKIVSFIFDINILQQCLSNNLKLHL